MAAQRPEVRLVQGERWKEVWQEVKDTCQWAGALEFLNGHPGACNNQTPWSGCTLMVQAMFFGVDKGVLESLKACGADPNIRDFQGRLPTEHCESLSQRRRMEALLLEVYGPDDEEARLRLIKAAKEGDLTSTMSLLKQKPHLVNAQSYRGWTVLHQVCYHGVSQSLLATLVQMKACLEIQNDEGHTPKQVHEIAHPERQLIFPGSKTIYAPGMAVIAHSVGRSFKGSVQEIEGGNATIIQPDGQLVTVPVWRVCPVLEILDTPAGVAGFTTDVCSICDSPVGASWKISPHCHGTPHLYCGACAVNFVWTQFESLPMKCVTCQAPVEPGQLKTSLLGRNLLANWPPASRRDTSELSYDQFVQNVAEKMQLLPEEQKRLYREWLLNLLATCTFTDRPIAHCNFDKCPKFRGCPNCGVCIEYESACKHMKCIHCKHRFCFLCLRSQEQHTGGAYNWSISVVCPLEPRQTERTLPVLP